VGEIAVFHGSQRVGAVEADDGSFAYDPAWLRNRNAFPVSIQMPLVADRTPPGVFERWGAHLLPGGPQRAVLAQRLGMSPGDAIGMLARIGGDAPGALSFGDPALRGSGRPTPTVDESALGRALEALAQRPLPAGEAAAAITLGGARPKLPVALDGAGGIAVAHGDAPSTHILKPASPELFGGVQNEALCLVLARRCGLDAPCVTTGKAGSRSYLLVERYDRVPRDGGVRSLHQESFAQALGKAAGEAPSLAEVLALTRRVMCAPDVLALVDAFIFNVLICNPAADAGAFALLFTGEGARLAPIHGITAMTKWEGASPRLGRMLAGEHIDWPQWKAFAAECGLNAARLIARLEMLASAVLAEVRDAAAVVAAMPAGPHPLLPHLVEAIETRARRHRSIAERFAARARRKHKAGAGRAAPRPIHSVSAASG
jgi:serine/threonine-protein kinase HipA